MPDKERVESNMKSLNDSVFCLWCLVANKLDIHEQTSMFCFFQFVKSQKSYFMKSTHISTNLVYAFMSKSHPACMPENCFGDLNDS